MTAEAGPRFEQTVEREEAAHDVLRRFDAVGTRDHEPITDRVLSALPPGGPTGSAGTRVIDAAYVTERLADVVGNTDLSGYIL